jgi:hypothetical protein
VGDLERQIQDPQEEKAIVKEAMPLVGKGQR